jgi:hypothetical protein
MAGAAANGAMDCQRSLQTFHPSDRPEWRELDALLPGDIVQWQTAKQGVDALYVYSFFPYVATYYF